MPSRRLPNTDDGRLSAMRAAKNKAESTSATDLAFSAETLKRLDDFLPLFRQEMNERGEALSGQAESTGEKEQAQERAAMFISHFIQGFNHAVARGKYSAADRAYYQLHVNQEDLPELSSASDVTLWGKNLIDGEAARTAAGGEAMSNPTIAEVEVAYNDFVQKDQAQSAQKDEYDKEQEDVEAKRPEADDLVLDIWDEVEFTFRKDDPPSKRRKAREYGVVYVSRPGEEPEEGVLPAEEPV